MLKVGVVFVHHDVAAWVFVEDEILVAGVQAFQVIQLYGLLVVSPALLYVAEENWKRPVFNSTRG